MRQQVKLVKGVVTRETSMVGPRHDPYGRTTIEFHAEGGSKVWELVLCALAGCKLTDFRTGEEFAIWEGGPEFEEKVEQVTGQDTRFWDEKLWECKERALLARVGRKEYEDICMMREADERLLRYAL